MLAMRVMRSKVKYFGQDVEQRQLSSRQVASEDTSELEEQTPCAASQMFVF